MDDQDLIERAAAVGQGSEVGQARLGRGDWLIAGLRILIDEGIDAVRITRLADDLGVTRGSFYWHFRDRDDLLNGLIEFWSQKNTAAVREAVAGAPSLTDGILALFDAWIDPERFDPRLDHAMRDWARRSDRVRRAVDDADTERVAVIASLYRGFGYDEDEAFIRARVIYFGQIGYYALDLDESLAARLANLEAYYLCFTGTPIDPAAAAAYRRRYLNPEDPNSEKDSA